MMLVKHNIPQILLLIQALFLLHVVYLATKRNTCCHVFDSFGVVYDGDRLTECMNSILEKLEIG